MVNGSLFCDSCHAPSPQNPDAVFEDKNVLPEENKASVAVKPAVKKRK